MAVMGMVAFRTRKYEFLMGGSCWRRWWHRRSLIFIRDEGVRNFRVNFRFIVIIKLKMGENGMEVK